MHTQFKPGDEFLLEGRCWICLEPKRTRMVAVETRTLRLASVLMRAPLEKTGVSRGAFISAIEEARMNLSPGTKIYLEGRKFIVKGVTSNGDIEVENEMGGYNRMRKWAPWWKNFISLETLLSKVD